MRNPIFAMGMRDKKDMPPISPTNAERVQAFRAIAPVHFGNTTFCVNEQFADQFLRNPAQPSRAGIPFDPNPPTQEEVAEAYRFKYHG